MPALHIFFIIVSTWTIAAILLGLVLAAAIRHRPHLRDRTRIHLIRFPRRHPPASDKAA